MVSTKTKARVGVKSAKLLARHPTLRRATVRAARPTSKVGWKASKPKARKNATETARKRVVPALAVGVAIVALALYFLEPKRGPDRRRRLQERLSSRSETPNPSAAGVQV